MRFLVDDDNLALICELTDEPNAVNFKDHGLGSRILDIAGIEMNASAKREQSPDGLRWSPLAPVTVDRKNAVIIGIRTGEMVLDLLSGIQEITRRRIEWRYPYDELQDPRHGKVHGFHNGRGEAQPPRRLIGWTREAKRKAREMIDLAVANLANQLA